MGISPYPLNNRRFVAVRLTDVEFNLLDQGAACFSISRSEYLRKLLLEKQIIDLLAPAERKITQKEYMAQKDGQQKPDEINQKIIEDGLKPTSTVSVSYTHLRAHETN